ncbi:hypothetical protein D9758_005735 [Tetrapyrgos nigripes]|uniref:Probable RNA-binding protein 18 n=1 Tax=Tetrapyrgos nigripes TaxID=182062 RepID=A0A8H5GKB0_9AGAR|nr:hypothetical protein D9758_005735 [Tetrapyrgos nigripes]
MDLLQFPEHSTELQEPESRQFQKDRLFVGNLASTVDEYSLLQLFTKYGKVTKFDFLFHKSGPLKGKPRGYAFIQYANEDDAKKALTSAHDKLFRGRKLAVTHANQAPLDTYGSSSGSRPRKGMMESGRPTTLSMLKSGGKHSEDTSNKIAMLEAKLRQMESSKPSSSNEASSSASTSTLPSHPSLPLKPPPQSSGAPPPTKPKSIPTTSSSTLLPSTISRNNSSNFIPSSSSSKPLPNIKSKPNPGSSTTTTMASTKSKGGLAGVKIVKKGKEKDKEEKDVSSATTAMMIDESGSGDNGETMKENED